MRLMLQRLALVAAVLAAMPVAALAEPVFTVKVPVKLQAIHPDVTQVRISCSLKAKESVTGNIGSIGPTMPPSTEIYLTKSGGNFSGVIEVVFDRNDFDAGDLKSLSSVTEVSCWMGLITATGNYVPQPANHPGSSDVVKAKPGTPFKPSAWLKLIP
jgi:hypothetical protein